MGVVLPHGGFVAETFKDPELEWCSVKVRLAGSATLLQSAFAKPRSELGNLFNRRNRTFADLVLVHNDANLEWQLEYGETSVGLPPYFMTRQTFDALGRAVDVSRGTVEIDGVRYQLRAAFLRGVHVALLVRVDS